MPTDNKAQPTAAMRAAEIIWRDTDTFDLPTEQGVPKLAAIIERETLCGEMLETMRRLTGQCRQFEHCVVCGSGQHEDNCWVPKAERLIAKIGGE